MSNKQPRRCLGDIMCSLLPFKCINRVQSIQLHHHVEGIGIGALIIDDSVFKNDEIIPVVKRNNQY